MVTNGSLRAFLVFSLLTVALHLLRHSVLMSNTPAHFTLCFVLSDWQGRCKGRLLQSRDELQKSPIPGCTFHYHWNRDVCGGGCGPHSLPVQAWTCIALGPHAWRVETVDIKMKGRERVDRYLPLLKVCVIVEAGSLQKQKLYEEKEQKESKRRKYVWTEYYLDSILIWIESLFLECNTPDPSIKTQKDSAEKDDYSSTKTVLHLSKKKMNS